MHSADKSRLLEWLARKVHERGDEMIAGPLSEDKGSKNASIFSFNYKAGRMAIGKEIFMWECSSICPHRWGELARERPTWASHTTTNSRSKQISTQQICWFLLQQKSCLWYISIFQQTTSLQSLSIDKRTGKSVVQNINVSDFYCTSQTAVIWLAYCFRENRKQERMVDVFVNWTVSLWEINEICLIIGWT